MADAPCPNCALSGTAAVDCARELGARLAAANAEVERLRAILAGRTTPPTLAEQRAWLDVGNGARVRYRWRCVAMVNGSLDYADGMGAFDIEALRGAVQWERWWALDASGAPCAGPTAEGTARDG